MSLEIVKGVARIVVTSDGRSNDDFRRSLEADPHPHRRTMAVVNNARFVPTTGVTYRIPIIMGSKWSYHDVLNKNILKEAARRRYLTLPFEAACLIGEALSGEQYEELGLSWIIGMHDPVEDHEKHVSLIFCCDRHSMRATDEAAYPWSPKCGFAFLSP